MLCEANQVPKTKYSGYICMTFWKRPNCWDKNHFKMGEIIQQSLGKI